jgi:hypothetical protein
MEFDALEQRAAGRFVQVADVAAAAAYSARWACQPRAAGIGSHALSAASAAMRAAATALQKAMQAMHARRSQIAAQASRPAHSLLNYVTPRLPATVRGRAAALVDAVATALQGEASVKNSRPDEWWKQDPNRRPSLWSPAGWQRLAAVVQSALPSLQTIVLQLSRAVPGFADMLLSLQRHEPLCVKQLVGAVLADAAGAAHRRQN